jgi:hypothetical protein
MPQSNSRAPDASTLQSVEVCERKTHAQPDSFAVTGVLCAVALVANMPHAYDDPCRLAHAGTIQQENKCARGLKDACAARFHMAVALCASHTSRPSAVVYPLNLFRSARSCARVMWSEQLEIIA